MSLSDEELRDWVESYIAAYDQKSKQDPDNWAIHKFMDLASENPEQCWQALVDVLNREPGENVLGALAAGPLEDLIEDHGELFIERIEIKARQEPLFRRLLGGVCEAGRHEIWNRVLKARNNR